MSYSIAVMATPRRKQPPFRELKEDERMVLIGADREVFLDAVMNPPEPSERLMAALRRHREILG